MADFAMVGPYPLSSSHPGAPCEDLNLSRKDHGHADPYFSTVKEESVKPMHSGP
uniref:Uncharacterized protein n=1 Tax=Leersia perrieri TaxID=77586 RepID=A0A0D9XBC7_9ORYZ